MPAAVMAVEEPVSSPGPAGGLLTPVLREYSLIAAGERSALLAPDGAIAWLCAPRWDTPAAFSGLLETSFSVEVMEGVPAVTAPEEVDIANAALLQKALAEAAGPGQVLVVVDMCGTRFCDSAGLNALVAADRRARAEGGEVRLVITGESAARIVELTGVDRVIPIYASLEQRSPEPGG